MFTRFGAMLGRVLPPEVVAQGLRGLILKHCGNPAQYGAPEPAENIFEADISKSQYYLAYVAEGKILPRRGVAEVTEDGVIFEGGGREQVDAIVLATGYKMNPPFLSDEILRVINADDAHIGLYHHTFHPDMPNLAFVGLYVQIGTYFPVVELQARWIAMVWAGATVLPSREQMLDGIREFREVTAPSTDKAQRSGDVSGLRYG